MRCGIRFIFFIIVLAGTTSVRGEETSSVKRESESAENRGIAVYGLETADYLDDEVVKRVKEPLAQKKYQRSRVGFNVPKSFYYVGAPIFFLLFLRVMVLFIRLFEEERKEELKQSRLKALGPE